MASGLVVMTTKVFVVRSLFFMKMIPSYWGFLPV